MKIYRFDIIKTRDRGYYERFIIDEVIMTKWCYNKSVEVASNYVVNATPGLWDFNRWKEIIEYEV